MSYEPAITVRNLSKCYQIYDRPEDRLKQGLWRGRKRFYREFWALRDVSFEVRKGDTVGIIGRNGSGKSTLLQLIAGTLTATAGSVEVNGRIAALLELGSGFNPEFTGRENVYMNGAILGLDRAEIDRRFDAIAAFADIGEFIDQPVKTYSSGMMVRLAFSVSVNVEPEILIVDEALAVGDMGFQFKCMERLERLTRSGTTLLFVSHDIAAIKAFCGQVIYLVNGRMRAQGTPDEMTELYFLDLRDSQRSAQAGSHPVTMKPFLGEGEGIAFGTDQGRIVEAVFLDTGGLRSCYANGDEIRIRVAVEFLGSIKNPCVSIVIMDRRMIPLSGKVRAVANGKPVSGNARRATLIFSLRSGFAPDAYYVTVRLEERVTDSAMLLIDKQVGLLSFDVVKGKGGGFLGMVDLAIASEEVDG
jgi:lipopolysaccharide transport system ATP-binding protein